VSAEPDLERTRILEVLGNEYGLRLDSIAFIPDGTAHAYRTEGMDGRYFVKLLPKAFYGAQMLERVTAEVPLLRALRHNDILTRVPRVLHTRDGADLSRIQDHPVLVYEWLEASNLSSRWTAALPELAPLLGRLHAGTRAITSSVTRLPVAPEDFGFPFETQLLENLHTLDTLPPEARPGVHALRDLLEPHRTALRELLERARFFQRAARARPREQVVCHTDAHGGNVMRDDHGDLWIIDWETARLAPPEHDLWMLHERLPEILPAYTNARGQDVRLDLDVIGFYFCRRVLEDVAVDVNMILHENTRPEQDTSNLEIVERYVLPSLSRLEVDLERLSTALSAIRG
jgi:spectinomycin phosphotransferase